MSKEIGLIKSNWERSEDRYWINFYPTFTNFNFTLDAWGYFDSRPVLHFQLTTIFSLILLVPFGLNWLSLLLFLTPWGNIFMKLPYNTGKYDECESPEWGVYFYSHEGRVADAIWFRLGKKYKVINMPWSVDWVRTSVLLKRKGIDRRIFEEDRWEHETKGNRKEFWSDEWKDKIKYETYPYRYILKSGMIQDRIATVHIKEREWRRRGLMWTKLFNIVSRTMEVEFNDEVGERSGSWKGGTVGCSYTLNKGESMSQCLRRMEKERKF